MTKPITGVAIMKQVERGLVSLDDPLDKFIPEYAEMEIGRPSGDDIEIIGRAQGKIKILHLLTHTSGVGCGELGAALSKRFSLKGEYNIADIAKEYSAFPISFEPFTAQAYSGAIGFDLLARVVFAPYEIPVGIVLSVAGCPFFLWLLLRRKGRNHD